MTKSIKYNVVDTKGKDAGSVDLDPAIFAVDADPSVVHQVVRWQLAKRRAGTHATQNLSKTDNNKKKPYRQKGTGRSRAGSRYSPIRVGGAVAHGPQPRSYDFKVNSKVKAKALCSVLTDKCRSETLRIVDKLELAEPKTKNFKSVLAAVTSGAKAKRVIVVINNDLDEKVQNVMRAGSNMKEVNFLEVAALNVYDLVNADCVIFDQDCIAGITQRFGKAEAKKAEAKKEA